MVTLEKAVGAAQRAIDAAKKKDAVVAVAVCNKLGRLKAFLKMDGTQEVIIGHEAMRRAIHAAAIGAPSDDTSKPVRFGIVEAEGIGGSIEAGGLPCLRDGEVIGSVGVAGADDAVCVHCAEAGLLALQGGQG